LLNYLSNYTRTTPIPVKMPRIDSEKMGPCWKINVAVS